MDLSSTQDHSLIDHQVDSYSTISIRNLTGCYGNMAKDSLNTNDLESCSRDRIDEL